MEEKFFKSILLMDSKTGKIDVPLSVDAFDGTILTKKSTLTVSTPGTPESVFSGVGLLKSVFVTNTDSSAHHVILYDGTTEIGRVFVDASSSTTMTLNIPIENGLNVDSDSSVPIITVVYR